MLLILYYIIRFLFVNFMMILSLFSRKSPAQDTQAAAARQAVAAAQAADPEVIVDSLKGKHPWEILGVSMNADLKTVKKSYYKISRKHYPDKGGVEAVFKLISGNYETMADPNELMKYKLDHGIRS